MVKCSSNHTKCVSLNNQQCMTQPTLINLHPNKYSQGFCFYTFEVDLDRCVRICNTRHDLSNRVCIPTKTEDLKLNAFNINKGINE